MKPTKMDVPRNSNQSLWVATTPPTSYPRLSGTVSADVAVVGGGITGLTTALLLQQEGATVALVEARRIALGTTGYTTAKVTALHGLIYGHLVAAFGPERARLYADANVSAISRIEGLIGRLGIECDHRRADAFTFSASRSRVREFEEEAEAANRLGVPVDVTVDPELPVGAAVAVRLGEQALFHPRSYCLGLASALDDAGAQIFERSRALDVHRTGPRVAVVTDGGRVEADHAVIATLLPFEDPRALFARSFPSRSYAIAAEAADVPSGMYLSVDAPTRSIRPHVLSDGRSLLIVEGEEHKTGQDDEPQARYEALESWGVEHLGLRSVAYRWSAQDYITPDRVPYVGRLRPADERVLAATGFNKWGMTNGTAAAVMLSDLVLGRSNPWIDLFDAGRIKPEVGAGTVVKENLNVAKRFVGDRIAAFSAPPSDELRPGEGGVVEHNGSRVAAHRDADGTLHAVSPVCTHMGCLVGWNGAESTWDCPCHGSRFSADGDVIEGPATEALQAVSTQA